MVAVVGLARALLERQSFAPGTDPNGPSDEVSSQTRANALLGSCISLMLIMLITMITRVYCRAVLLKKMGSDDWCMIMAAICAVGLVVCSCLGIPFGAGKHQWTVPWQDSLKIKKLNYIGQILYFLGLGFCKASLLLFIIRLTPSPRMVLLCWSILAFCTAFTFAAFVTSCLQCIPVSYVWNQLNPQIAGSVQHTCVAQRPMQFALPGINILTDLVVWMLPIKMVWNVQLPVRQKWTLIAVFSLGGLGVVSAAFRMWSVSKAIGAKDGTWYYLDLSIWSSCEVMVSIICGSAPAVKPFFSCYLPTLLGGSTFNRSAGPRSRGGKNAYELGSVSARGKREHTSTEVLDAGVRTRIEATGSERGSEEFEEERGGIVKSTDVQVVVEERV